MHPRVDQLIQQLQWHASVEGESLDVEYCESLNPAKVLAKARRAGLQIEEARAGISHLQDAKIGDSTDTDAPPLLTKSAFRLFSSALWNAFNQDSSDSEAATETAEHAERNGPSKKQAQPKRRKVSSTSAVASGSQNPPDGDTLGAPNRTPSKARSTRSTVSFKGKHVLHVAKDAASPHAEDEHRVGKATPSTARSTRRTVSFKGKHVLHVAKDAASLHAEEHRVEEARSKPARTPKKLPGTKEAGASKLTAAASAKRTAASKRKAQAPVRKMPLYRTRMLSTVQPQKGTACESLSGRAMDGFELSVQFECNEDDGSYLFDFPCGERIQVTENDVERSLPLRDMLETAANCGETTITFPCSVELSHSHIWAAAVQPDSPVFQTDAEGMKRALEAADFFADRCVTQRLAAAYDVQLFPVDTFAPDADFLRVLEGMSGELASTVLAASFRTVGERAWRLPERLHPLDEAIAAATAAAESQRATPEGQKETDGLGGSEVSQVSTSPEGRWFATCGQHGHVAVWHTATFKLVRTLQGNRRQAHGHHDPCIAWSPDGRLLASGCSVGTVTVWNVATGAVTVSLRDDGGDPGEDFRAISAVAWSPDGLKLCTAGYGSVTVWELVTGEVMNVLQADGFENDFKSVAWSPDGACIATGAHTLNEDTTFESWRLWIEGGRLGRTVRVWDAVTGDCVHSLISPGDRTSIVAWRPLESMLAAAGETIYVWDVAKGTTATTPKHTLRRSQGHTSDVTSVAWSPDGRHLAIGDFNGERLSVWEVATGTSVRVVPNKGAYVTSVAWSPCGSLLFASAGKAVHVYNMQNS